MWRASIHYSRKGVGVHAISAVDIALWDLLGKVKGEPVYNLLGGKTKNRVPCYATTARPDLAQQMGFHGAKFPLPYGPEAGNEGMRKNIEFCAQWREKCGPDFPLMLDCYMALDVNYAAELARKLMPYDIKWIEEALMPDEYEAHAKLAEKMKGMGTTSYVDMARGTCSLYRGGGRGVACADLRVPVGAGAPTSVHNPHLAGTLPPASTNTRVGVITNSSTPGWSCSSPM